eukprot:4729931-Prymnesium_polylepis.1
MLAHKSSSAGGMHAQLGMWRVGFSQRAVSHSLARAMRPELSRSSVSPLAVHFRAFDRLRRVCAISGPLGPPVLFACWRGHVAQAPGRFLLARARASPRYDIA